MKQSTALAAMERLSAVTHLLSGLEYLTTEQDRAPGGFNNWEFGRREYRRRWPRATRVLDVVADRRVTRGLHVGQVGAALALLAPTPRGVRAAANGYLSLSSLVLYPRQLFGTDGSDQVAFLVSSVSTVARLGQRNPKLVDACLWFVSLQSVLSYTVSGWVKLSSPTWRSGRALPNIMRTVTYGDKRTWQLLRRYPRTARVVGAGVLAMECAYPLVYAAKGRFAPAMVGAATAFHVANGAVMGLGRFVSAFGAMHPAVLYTSGRRERTAVDGTTARRRDNLVPALAVGTVGAALTVGAVLQARRRRKVLAGRGDEQVVTTSSGNRLSYRITGSPGASTEPVIVFETALAATAEYWERIGTALGGRYEVLTYHRAGYGPSACADPQQYSLQRSVQDLVELVAAAVPNRALVLVGHSLGGYLALLAAAAMPARVRGLSLLDASHPGQIKRSTRQRRGAQRLSVDIDLLGPSLRLGLGNLLERPEWMDKLPGEVQDIALAQYRDHGMWRAARREWQEVLRHFATFGGELPTVDVPVQVITAGLTTAGDPVHDELQQEFVKVAPRAERHVIADATHDELLIDAEHAARVAELLGEFVGGITPGEGAERSTA